jgi:hypothetical protein
VIIINIFCESCNGDTLREYRNYKYLKKIHKKIYIVACRPISRQHPKYAHATIEKILEEVFSVWSAPRPVLGNWPIETHSDNRRRILYVVRAIPSAG